jgi:hypothetical protein
LRGVGSDGSQSHRRNQDVRRRTKVNPIRIVFLIWFDKLDLKCYRRLARKLTDSIRGSVRKISPVSEQGVYCCRQKPGHVSLGQETVRTTGFCGSSKVSRFVGAKSENRNPRPMRADESSRVEAVHMGIWMLRIARSGLRLSHRLMAKFAASMATPACVRPAHPGRDCSRTAIRRKDNTAMDVFACAYASYCGRRFSAIGKRTSIVVPLRPELI